MSNRLAPLILFAIGAGLSLLGAVVLDDRIVTAEYSDRWFESDIPQVFDSLTNLQSFQRTLRHPLFTVLFYPPVKALRLIGLDHLVAVRLLVIALAGLWSTIFGLVLKRTTGSWSTAAPFLLLFFGSACFMFWAPVAETFVAGSVSILMAVALVAYHVTAPALSLGVSLLTFGTTTTNWIAGLVALALTHRWKVAAGIAALTIAIGAALSIAQVRLLPRTEGTFFQSGNETPFVSFEPDRMAERWRAFFSHSVVIPRPVPRTVTYPPTHISSSTILSVEQQAAGAGLAGTPTVLWWLLLGMGCYGLATTNRDGRYRVALVAIVFGQLVLHSLFGLESFLYSAHYGPLLILVAAWSVHMLARPVVLTLAWFTGLTVAVYNARIFLLSAEMLHLADQITRSRPIGFN